MDPLPILIAAACAAAATLYRWHRDREPGELEPAAVDDFVEYIGQVTERMRHDTEVLRERIHDQRRKYSEEREWIDKAGRLFPKYDATYADHVARVKRLPMHGPTLPPKQGPVRVLEWGSRTMADGREITFAVRTEDIR